MGVDFARKNASRQRGWEFVKRAGNRVIDTIARRSVAEHQSIAGVRLRGCESQGNRFIPSISICVGRVEIL